MLHQAATRVTNKSSQTRAYCECNPIIRLGAARGLRRFGFEQLSVQNPNIFCIEIAPFLLDFVLYDELRESEWLD